MIELDITASSQIGHVRHNNEDMVLVDTQFIRNDEYRGASYLNETDRMLLAVADGMGGHQSGEVASSETLRSLQYYFYDLPANLTPSDLKLRMAEWLTSMNNVIESKGMVDPSMKGMGTTLVALGYYNGQFFTMNCGDSRLYRYRDSHLWQLSQDHSLVAKKGGKERRTNVITNCVGGGTSDSFLDMVMLTADDVREGDQFLLCSDGLSDILPDSQMERRLSEGTDAIMLCQEAVVEGGFDNVSACLAKVRLLKEKYRIQ